MQWDPTAVDGSALPSTSAPEQASALEHAANDARASTDIAVLAEKEVVFEAATKADKQDTG